MCLFSVCSFTVRYLKFKCWNQIVCCVIDTIQSTNQELGIFTLFVIMAGLFKDMVLKFVWNILAKLVVDVGCKFIGALAFVLHCFVAKEVNKKQIDAQRKQLEAGTNYLGKNKILLVLEGNALLLFCFSFSANNSCLQR